MLHRGEGSCFHTIVSEDTNGSNLDEEGKISASDLGLFITAWGLCP